MHAYIRRGKAFIYAKHVITAPLLASFDRHHADVCMYVYAYVCISIICQQPQVTSIKGKVYAYVDVCVSVFVCVCVINESVEGFCWL